MTRGLRACPVLIAAGARPDYDGRRATAPGRHANTGEWPAIHDSAGEPGRWRTGRTQAGAAVSPLPHRD